MAFKWLGAGAMFDGTKLLCYPIVAAMLLCARGSLLILGVKWICSQASVRDPTLEDDSASVLMMIANFFGSEHLSRSGCLYIRNSGTFVVVPEECGGHV